MCDAAPAPSDFSLEDAFAVGLGGNLDPNAIIMGGYYDTAEDQWKEALGIGDKNIPEASTLRARIAREQWEDYKTRFQPLENVLIGYANNRQGYINKNRQESINRIGQVYDRAPEQIERRMTSYGLQVTPEQRERIAQKTNYQRGLAQVQAANVSDRLSQDQLQGIIGGGLLLTNRNATTNNRPVGG